MLDAEILGSYPCVLVEGLDVIEGHFAFCGSSFYILRGVGLDVAKDTLPEYVMPRAKTFFCRRASTTHIHTHAHTHTHTRARTHAHHWSGGRILEKGFHCQFMDT